MPVHDWTKVSAGTFHDFHVAWIAEIRNALNTGVLPPAYYAMAEQIVGNLGPDVLTLQRQDSPNDGPGNERQGMTAVEENPPQVHFVAQTEMDDYILKQRTLVIRHSSDDRIIALIEIVSPGNKASRHG